MKPKSTSSLNNSFESKSNSIFIKKSFITDKNVNESNFESFPLFNLEEQSLQKLLEDQRIYKTSLNSENSLNTLTKLKLSRKVNLRINSDNKTKIPFILKKISEQFLRYGVKVETDNLLKKRNYFTQELNEDLIEKPLDLNPKITPTKKIVDKPFRYVLLKNIEQSKITILGKGSSFNMKLSKENIYDIQRRFVLDYKKKCENLENDLEFLISCLTLRIPIPKNVYCRMDTKTKLGLTLFLYQKYINKNMMMQLFDENDYSSFFFVDSKKNKSK